MKGEPSPLAHCDIEPGDLVWYRPTVAGYGYLYPMKGIPATVWGTTKARIIIGFRTADGQNFIKIATKAAMLSKRTPELATSVNAGATPPEQGATESAHTSSTFLSRRD